LSHSELKRTILVGTPKLLENQLEAAYARSTACEWTLTCSNCAADVILDQRCLGAVGVVCTACQTFVDVSAGRWVARNPDAEWGQGFWINHLMVPWLNYHEILVSQRSYDLAQFKNEVLGLPTTLGEHVVTRAELEACCGEQPMAKSANDIVHTARRHLIAGIDWGGGRTSRTVVVIGYYRDDNKFVVAHMQSYRADEDPQRLIAAVAELCRLFDVKWIAADGRGNGLTTNRLLVDQLQYRAHLYGIVYSEHDHEPVQDGTLWMWTVNRSSSIGLLYSLVRKGLIVFPPVNQCGWFLDELACELAEYDDEKRRIRYTRPESQRDDALHATNYAIVLLNRWLDYAHRP
jgi:hypothetical protein